MIANLLSGVALAALVTLSTVHGTVLPRKATDGINDRGSSYCSIYQDNNMEKLQTAVDKIEPGTVFHRDEQIACASYNNKGGVGAICASLCDNDNSIVATVQKSYKDDDPARNIWSPVNRTNFGDVIGDLRYIGAKGCGTAPLLRAVNATSETKNGNDLGCITVNYRMHPCGQPAGDPCKITNPPAEDPTA